jgi:hypothetical protein
MVMVVGVDGTCTGGQFFRGTGDEFRVKDTEGRLRIINGRRK